MKKIYYLRLWLIAAMLSIAYSASAYDVEVNGIYYNLCHIGVTASVTSGDGNYVGEVVIPSEIKVKEMTYIVDEIDSYAFYECSDLTSVTIPNSVTKIGDSAFYGCSGLTSVIIPNSVTTIDSEAFGYCSNLISVTIPESVISIWANAFDGTAWYDNLPDGLIYIGKIAFKYKGTMPDNTSINIKDGTNIIAGGAFEDCFGLTSVTIPNSVTKITYSAFCGCTGLTSVTIPNSVTEIEEGVFYGCSGLTSVTIPNSVTSIDNGAFDGCIRLATVTIPSSVTKIGRGAFNKTAWYDNQPDGLMYIGKVLYKYKGVMPDNTSITIKDGTINITSEAFEYCTGLTSVTIPNSVTEIADCLFYECSGLTSVIIPNSVTEIGEMAFEGCSGLTSLTIGNSVKYIGHWAFALCSGLTSLIIPNSVTSIGYAAFAGCEGLTSVIIPNSVTEIGEMAFWGCSRITKITIPKTVKCIGPSAFACNDKLQVYVEWNNPSDETLSFDQQPFSDKIMQYGALYVPTGTKALYEQYDPWRNFFNIKEYTPSGIEEIEAEGGVTIGVEGGKIVVNGAGDTKVEVFGTNGAAVYSGSADNLPELAAGIYIVRVGSTVKKVAIAK